MEGLWTRFLPAWVQVKKWLDADLIGEIKVISSTFGVRIPRDKSDRLLNIDSAGGVLLDMGIYNIALYQFVLGRNPEKILADGFVGETGVDERSSALLNYGNAISMFTSNFESTTENNFTISGITGTIEVQPNFWESSQTTLKTDYGKIIQFDQPFRASGFEYEAEEVMQCVRTGKLQSHIMPWSNTLGNMQTMDEILSQIGVNYPFSPR